MANRKISNRIISVILTAALALGLFPLFTTAAGGALMGDVDYDGVITSSDARLTLRAAVGLERFDSVQTALSDLDGDNTTAAADARLTLRAAVGLEPLRRSNAPLTGLDAATAARMLPQENPTSGCSAPHYQLTLSLDTKAQTVTGTAAVQIRNNTDTPVETLCFRLYSASITKGSKITKAQNANEKRAYHHRPDNDPSVVFVELGADAIHPGDTLTVSLDFISVIPKIDDRFGYHKSARGTIYNLTFCFPQLSFLSDGVWDTDPYFNSGETTVNETADYDVTFTAPKDYTVVSAGTSETKAGKTVIHADGVREMAITACNFAEIKEVTARGVRFRLLMPSYDFYGGDKRYREALYDMILETAVASAGYYAEKIGPYLYDELDIVPIPMESAGGMEMPGLIYVGVAADMITEDGVVIYDDFAYVYDTVAHEAAHEWFCCAVGNDQYDEPWLDEAFATFCAGEYLLQDNDAKKHADALEKTYSDINTAVNVYWNEIYYPYHEIIAPVNLRCGDYADDYTYAEAVYTVGCDFLWALCDHFGEDAFFGLLSEWYAENCGRIVKGRQFVSMVLAKDNADEVKQIVNAYLDGSNL